MTRWFIGFLLLGVVGCSPSVITTHARAAQVVAPVLDAARVAIHAARAADLDACATVELPRECLDEREARWALGVAAYNLVREGYVAWVEGMSLASLTGVSDALLPLALALLSLYQGVETALEPFEELDLPDFPGLGLLTGGE